MASQMARPVVPSRSDGRTVYHDQRHALEPQGRRRQHSGEGGRGSDDPAFSLSSAPHLPLTDGSHSSSGPAQTSPKLDDLKPGSSTLPLGRTWQWCMRLLSSRTAGRGASRERRPRRFEPSQPNPTCSVAAITASQADEGSIVPAAVDPNSLARPAARARGRATRGGDDPRPRHGALPHLLWPS